MKAGPSRHLDVLADVIQRFRLQSLNAVLQACAELARDDAPLDVAVLGQFKSGKSSLLNAVLGEAVFPVGVVPVTTVITRASAGPGRAVRVTYQDGRVEEVALGQVAELVTEAGNPGNRRQVAVVDVFTPAMRDWPGMGLVDTPGLGSVFLHSTEATRRWMPNVAVALVTISADRPLSDEDRRLVAEARQTAPRVVVALTKVDLLTDAELSEVRSFLDRGLHECFSTTIPVLPFSSRVQPERWVRQLSETVLLPVATDVAAERRAALSLKLASLAQACRGYLEVGLQAVERADAARDRLRKAVLDESVNAAVIRDELRLVQQSVCEGTRPAFAQMFLAKRTEVTQRVTGALRVDIGSWQGNLAQQSQRYEAWLADRLSAELTPLSRAAAPLAAHLVEQAEARLRRVVEGFRDRLSRNIHEATGVTVSPVSWEVERRQVAVVPVAVSRAFMTDWELLWWLLPMWFVGGLFRRHIRRRVSWEVEKNLIRLTGDWAGAVAAAVTALRSQAENWVETELATLDQLLRQRPEEATDFRAALQRMEGIGLPPRS